MRMSRVEISRACCDGCVMVRALTTLVVLSAVYSMHKERGEGWVCMLCAILCVSLRCRKFFAAQRGKERGEREREGGERNIKANC